MIRVSLGTAAALGLVPVRVDAPATTAYILCGQGCALDCNFCPQARSSRSPAGMLSRVTWPAFELEAVVARLAVAAREGRVRRACLQVVEGPEGRGQARRALLALRAAVALPVSVSAALAGPAQAEEWLDLGAERVGIPLDGAGPRAFGAARGGDFGRALERVEGAARRCPGRVSTHVIVGLGETEEEVVRLLARLLAQGITVGLFAFTPVKGTRLEDRPPPDLGAYRRLQAAHWLLRRRLGGLVAGVGDGVLAGAGALSPAVDRALAGMAFAGGHIAGWGLEAGELGGLLADGEAFRTMGCPGCNRPYYNERPGGPMYNYPRPLLPGEAAVAVQAALSTGGRE